MRRFNLDGDWVDSDFLMRVFKLAAELKLASRFYLLPGDGQVAHFIYLTSGVHYWRGGAWTLLQHADNKLKTVCALKNSSQAINGSNPIV